MDEESANSTSYANGGTAITSASTGERAVSDDASDVNTPAQEGPSSPDAADATANVAEEPLPELLDPHAHVMWHAEQTVRRAEAQRIAALLKYIDSKAEPVRREGRDSYDQLKARDASAEQLRLCADMAQENVDRAEQAAIMYAAHAMNCSEHFVRSLQLTAEAARTRLPRVWKAFLSGSISALALRKIAHASDKGLQEDTLEKIDAAAPEVAQQRRPGQLEDWLRRFIARTEPRQAAERFTRAARDRYVSVKDVDDGMSLLTAVMPTLTAHAIKQRLDASARSPKQAIPHNPLIANQIHQQDLRIELTQALQQWMWSARHPETPQPHTYDSEHWQIGQVAQDLARSLQEQADSPVPRNDLPYPSGLHITDGAPIGLSAEAMQDPNAAEQQTSIGLPESREDGDPRNIEQRSLDLLTAWLLSGESPNGIEITAQIGILVPQAALIGSSDHPATTRNGRATIPGPHIRDLLRVQGNKLTWHELTTAVERDKSPGGESTDQTAHGENILSFRSSGRYPPPRLRNALLFRDGACTADGCRTASDLCDIDHILPWPQGTTTTDNLQVLCRRHHRLKTAGYNIGSTYTQAA